MTFNSEIQKGSLGAEVFLFDLDATSLGGEVHHFVSGVMVDGSPVLWRGNTYMPLDCKAEGFEVSSRGGLPRPHLSVSGVNAVFIGLVRQYQDLLGAVVTRWRTFERFLDNGPYPDPNAHYPVDVYIISRKIPHAWPVFEWEMIAAIDQENKKLPGRQVLRDICSWRYRIWTGEGFSYGKATCPYHGTAYYDAQGETCAAAADQCGKRKSDCLLRHPGQPLPFGGFPGVARTRL